MTNPESGQPSPFQEVWAQETKNNGRFSVVRIPKAVPIAIIHVSKRKDRMLGLSPVDPDGLVWKVQGRVTPSIIDAMGFRVSGHGRGSQEAIARHMEAIQRRFPIVLEQAEGKDRSWDISGTVPVRVVATFLDNSWQPVIEDGTKPRELWHVARRDVSYRDVPQKIGGENTNIFVVPRRS